MKPLLHDTTSKSVSKFITSPSHALLISGPDGSGKGTVAEYIVANLLNAQYVSIDDHPYIMRIRDQEKGVSIESIRSIQTFTQLKTPGAGIFRRAIIIEQGESMSTEAQNAFLKILEEPPADTIIIITTNDSDALLPTIQSRAQHIKILPLSFEKVTLQYSKDYSIDSIKKTYLLSQGYAGLTHSLLLQDTSHPLVEQIAVAKSLLSSSVYERLIRVDELSKQKNVALLIQAFNRICHAALTQSVKQGNQNAKQWTRRLKLMIEAEASLRYNPQQKLLLTIIMINL